MQVVGDFRGRKAVQFGNHVLQTGIQIKAAAIREKRAPLRIERNQIKIVFAPLSHVGKQAINYVWLGDDGRPHVKIVAALFPHVHFAAQMRVLLKQRDLMPRMG